MHKTQLRLLWALAVVAGSLGFCAAHAAAQTGGDPAEGVADAANPPRYIRELVEGSALTQEQVDAMRADGLGWGEIRIATRLAEQIDAASEDPLVTFDTALAGVLAERAAGKGFGEIAQAHNLKIGELVGKGSQKGGSAPGEDPASAQAGETKRLTEKKRGLFARLGGALGLGKGQRQDQTLKPEGSGTKTRTMTRAAKVKTLERPTRPEKPEKPAKLERPERPARPEKPEKPERGPNR